MVKTFTVLGDPKGKGRPRFSTRTGHAFTPKETVVYENLVKMEYIRQTEAYRFGDDVQLEMDIRAYYSIPKSGTKKIRQLKGDNVIRPMKKPDMDNVVKCVCDALNEVAYKDDVQIVDCRVRKYFSEQPRIEVKITDIPQEYPQDNSEGE